MSGTLQELLTVDFGAPLHCLALCGETHPLELEVRRHSNQPSPIYALVYPIAYTLPNPLSRSYSTC